MKICWDIFAIKNNLKHYFDDQLLRSKNVNILEKKPESSGKLKGGGGGLIPKFDKQKKVMIKPVFANKRNKTKQSAPDPTPMVSS